ncbi:hypothetical protein JANAI62_37880 [Jannaschia pagri]|uniref:Sce7725 family protein n=1 Tax=Jannaschia pagri TaxID=2829797 RepID=A0ABQ4NRZ1_9RHOB|nr:MULTISPECIES: sce7725 family protein [unclassified Jannaschia]GIT93350.1 hypothetical protein JANAI61_38080 [Jannaschia sp. AI_61]GIT97165.1 hypothetical protein JANAI62_37880 [Jannaschia sp. AI_62]
MIYFPYFRGKQYELITIRESAPTLSASSFVPIVEPVKSQLSGLSKTIDTTLEEGASIIVIVNPRIGDFSGSNAELVNLINEKHGEDKQVIVGVLLDESTTLEQASAIIDTFEGHDIALVHSGFSQSKALAAAIEGNDAIAFSVFEDGKSGKLYQMHFKHQQHRVLLRDGFEKRRNADHPNVEVFSDLHLTYGLEGTTGFADFLMVGDDYQESGGPAYTVAIHLTYINAADDDIMYIRHFKSDRQDTPTDPAGKFAEALAKLISHLGSPDNQYYETSAIAEFRELHDKGHYPGLGYVKKLAMKHHIETFAQYFEDNPAQ